MKTVAISPMFNHVHKMHLLNNRLCRYVCKTCSLILHYCEQDRRWMAAWHPVLQPWIRSAEVRGVGARMSLREL